MTDPSGILPSPNLGGRGHGACGGGGGGVGGSGGRGLLSFFANAGGFGRRHGRRVTLVHWSNSFFLPFRGSA